MGCCLISSSSACNPSCNTSAAAAGLWDGLLQTWSEARHTRPQPAAACGAPATSRAHPGPETRESPAGPGAVPGPETRGPSTSEHVRARGSDRGLRDSALRAGPAALPWLCWPVLHRRCSSPPPLNDGQSRTSMSVSASRRRSTSADSATSCSQRSVRRVQRRACTSSVPAARMTCPTLAEAVRPCRTIGSVWGEGLFTGRPWSAAHGPAT
jgi:hypothetical protein